MHWRQTPLKCLQFIVCIIRHTGPQAVALTRLPAARRSGLPAPALPARVELQVSQRVGPRHLDRREGR
jgi:hypothetical protein